jgi:undecaprenyl-diphosphatase
MSLVDAIILGIVQGITEFLPISSSGHLVLGQEVLGILESDNITFEVFVHFGTLLSIVAVFYRDIFEIFRSLIKGVLHPGRIGSLVRNDEHFRIALLILFGSVPAGIIGILAKSHIERAFSDVNLVGVMLMVTGFILFLTRLARPKPDKHVGWISAFIIGCAQALAIMPGISRAGMTISTGLFMGVSRDQAARFSFLLAVPAIFGATLLEAIGIAGESLKGPFLNALIAGTAAAFISGYFAIKTIFFVLRKDKFSYFSFYCLAVGIVVIILS